MTTVFLNEKVYQEEVCQMYEESLIMKIAAKRPLEIMKAGKPQSTSSYRALSEERKGDLEPSEQRAERLQIEAVTPEIRCSLSGKKKCLRVCLCAGEEGCTSSYFLLSRTRYSKRAPKHFRHPGH